MEPLLQGDFVSNLEVVVRHIKLSRSRVTVAAACAVLLFWPAFGSALDATREDVARLAKLPVTAADHGKMADSYAERAATWRAEADYHDRMATEYQAAGRSVEDAETMRKHCARIAANAREMAKEAEIMADYHRLRAKESK